MSNEIGPQEQTATVEPVESATTEETQEVESQEEQEQSEVAESETAEPSETTGEETGAEPAEGKVSVTELIKERHKKQDALREAEYWKEKALADSQAKQEQPAETPTADSDVPKLENYDSIEDHSRALVKYELKLEEKKKQQAAIEESYAKRYRKAAAENPELHETVSSAKFPISNDVMGIIKESEYGPQVAEYLAKNPDIGWSLLDKSPVAAAKEIYKIETKVATKTVAPTKKTVSQAPEPVKPVVGKAGSSVKSYDDMTDEEFMEHRNKQEFGYLEK